MVLDRLCGVLVLLLLALGWYLRRREDPRLTNLSAARQHNADHRARDAGLPPVSGRGGPGAGGGF